MTALNMDSFEAALKQHYTDLRVKNLVYRNNPFLAAVPKYEYFGGKNLPIPVQFGVPQGRSATFSDANNNQTPGNYTDYVLTRVKNYAIASIANETLEASVGNANAFMEAAASEIDGALRSLTQDLAGNLYRNQTGIRGLIATATGFAARRIMISATISWPDLIWTWFPTAIICRSTGRVLSALTAATASISTPSTVTSRRRPFLFGSLHCSWPRAGPPCLSAAKYGR